MCKIGYGHFSENLTTSEPGQKYCSAYKKKRVIVNIAIPFSILYIGSISRVTEYDEMTKSMTKPLENTKNTNECSNCNSYPHFYQQHAARTMMISVVTKLNGVTCRHLTTDDPINSDHPQSINTSLNIK